MGSSQSTHGSPHQKGDPTIPTDFITVIPSENEPDLAPPNKEERALLQRECRAFRILVIGKANAGKTTLLQRTCGTTEAPVIRNRHGKILNPSVIDPTDGRGIHNIKNELCFSSNPGLVFHDSPGFEAGSVTELKRVRKFIATRAAANELEDQLHAIWYCLPTDNDRPLSNAEMSFFEQGTGRVPVIAIFTKYDGMILKEYNRLRFEENFPKDQAMALAPVGADDLFRNSEFYIKRLQAAPYPPARYVRVQDMNNPASDCVELSKQTVDAVDSKKLKLLFISVQSNNIELCTEYAVRKRVIGALAMPDTELANPEAMLELTRKILGFYDHLVRLLLGHI